MAVRSAREAAYETIRSRIITMELKPGDELNDHALAQEMGISRTPMREALIMLNIAHMVTIKPQSGTYVAPIDLTLMEMEQFARYTLEKEILNHIRGRLTGEQERAYRLLIEQYRVLEGDSGAENPNAGIKCTIAAKINGCTIYTPMIQEVAILIAGIIASFNFA